MQKNIVYGDITAGGNVHIGDKIYVIERDFPNSILFLRIEKEGDAYVAMLSVKSMDDDTVNLFRETLQLTISENLFNKTDSFQNFRRGIEGNRFRSGFDTHSHENWETILTEEIYITFFSGDIGVVCRDFLNLLQSNKINELLLVISTEEEQIQNIPWEMVLPKLTPGVDNGLPKNSFGLIRSREKTLQRFNRQGPMAILAPLKLLFIPALPENLPERSKLLEIEQEQRKIIEAVRSLEVTGDQEPKLVMEILDCANLDEIKEALDARSHDIVHISGHGSYVDALKEGILYLEDEDGNEKQTSGRDLGVALRGFASIKLLVLSACETAVGGTEGSTAEQMVAVGFPAVLAMRFSVTDMGARLFTEKLYERLAYGETLTKAMHDARKQLWQFAEQSRAEALETTTAAEWFTPVLYQNQAIGSLVKLGQYNGETLNRFYPKAAFVKGSHTRLVGEGFIGRKRLLIQLRHSFNEGKHVSLHGLGGLGKTTTAEAFADLYRKRNSVHDILIFRNGTQIQEAVILETIYNRWKNRIKPEDCLANEIKNTLDNPKIAIEQKLQYLIDICLTSQRIILIFDNFEDVQTDKNGTQQQTIVSESLRLFLLQLLQLAPRTCHILFTTRYLIADFENLVTHLAIDKMSYAEQYRYINYSPILRKIPLNERGIIDRRFDGHPRALEFLERLILNDLYFNLTRLDASVGEIEKYMFGNMLLDRIYKKLNESEDIVFVAASSFINRSPIAALIFITGQTIEGIMPIMKTLRDWSLCFWNEREQTFEVHSLTRRWMRNTKTQETKEALAMAPELIGYYFVDQEGENNLFQALAYFKQVQAWKGYAKAVFKLTNILRIKGLYSKALELNREVVNHFVFINYYDFLDDEINKLDYYSLHIVALASFNKGVLLCDLGNFLVGYPQLESALRMAERLDDKKLELNILYALIGLERKSSFIDNEMAKQYLERGEIISMDIYGADYFDSTLKNNSIYNNLLSGKIDNIEALRVLQDGLQKHQQEEDKENICVLLLNIGCIYFAQGNLLSAFSYFEKCLNLSKEIGYRLFEINAYEALGEVSLKKGDRLTTLYYWEECLKNVRELTLEKKIAKLLNNIGKMNEELGYLDKALYYYEQSIFMNYGNNHLKCNTLHNMGGIYLSQKKYDEALIKLTGSLKLVQDLNDPKTEWTIRLDLSNVYYGKGEYNEAIKYFIKNIEISKEINDISKLVFLQMQIGIIYFDPLKEFEKAVYYLLQAKNNFKNTTLHDKNLNPANDLARIKMEIGETRFNQILESIQNNPPT